VSNSAEPAELRLYPSRQKWLLLSLGCITLSGTAYGMLNDPQAISDSFDWAMAWFGVFLGLAGLFACALYMLPGASLLILTPDWFEYRAIYRATRFRWQDVSGFCVWEQYRHYTVIFNDDTKRGYLSDLNSQFCGRNATLPDTYGMPAMVLADLMTSWKEQASIATDSVQR
jgi:hypothetical protein